MTPNQSTLDPAGLSRAPENGGTAQGTLRGSFLGRAWHRVGTVLFVITFGVWYACVIAWEEARQDEINRSQGEGEA